MNEYEVTNQSLFTAELRDIILEDVEDRLTRKVLRAKIVDNSDKSDRRVNMTLVHQKRHSKSEEWQDFDAFNLATLKAGEEAKFYLDADATSALLTALHDLYAVSAAGLPNGRRGVVFVRDDGSLDHAQRVEEVLKFLSDGGGEVWDKITEAKLDIPAALAIHKIHTVRLQAVAEFERHVDAGDWDEGEWQAYFSQNEWIFGHGLAYCFLEPVNEQPRYGGITVSGTGGQRGDYLLATKADVSFTVLVEIKRPDTFLLSPQKYRNKVFNLSVDLTGGVSQLQSNCRTWTLDGSRQEENRESLNAAGIYTYEPKGILVIGRTSELANDINKKATFELFRRNLHNPEVITYDELLMRAKYLLAREAPGLENS